MYTDYTDDYSFARSHLTAGEAILWQGKPGKGHLLTAQDAFMIPFSIFWCGFAIFLFVSASSAGGFFGLFGISFVCVGLYLVVGRFFHTAWLRKRTRYVITNKKIIRLRGSRIDMLDIKTMPPMRLEAFADGSGTIRFGEQLYYRRGASVSMPGGTQAPFTLEVIPQVARVHQILSDIQR